MEKSIKDYSVFFINDIDSLAIGSSLCVTGVIIKKWHYKDKFGIQIQDITGNISVSLTASKYIVSRENFKIGDRIRLVGRKSKDKNNNPIISSVEIVEFIEEINQQNIDLDFLEQESLVLLSKIIEKIKTFLQDKNYIEIKTRVLSRKMGDEMMEPLLAQYPGFGAPAYFAPSPSPQLSEFLAVTLLPKVFTETVSITTSYRFPNGSTETPIIMAKSVNSSPLEIEKTIIDLSKRVFSALSDKKYSLEKSYKEWSENIAEYSERDDDAFLFAQYSANIPFVGEKWNSMVKTIQRLEDNRGSLLVESATEFVSSNTSITTITFYPSQYLNWIAKAPKRQLLNLWKMFDGGSIYG